MRQSLFNFGKKIIFLFFIFGLSSGFSQILTPESILAIKTVRSVAIQPQGKYVAYTLSVTRTANEAPGKGYTELWVVPTAGGEARAYVQKPNIVSNVGWTPDGKMITFQAKRDAVNPYTQVYAIPLNGGEARQLSHAPKSLSAYSLSPDGKSVAYLMKGDEPKAVRKAKKQGFDQEVEDTWHSVTHLYVESLASGEIQRVNKGDEHVWEVAWTPDSKKLIYRASKRPFIDDKYMHTDNYIVSAAGGIGKKIADTDGKLELASMSPGGKFIAWMGATTYNDPYTHSLFVMENGSSKVKNLHGDFFGTGETFVWKDSETILLIMTENTHRMVYEVSAKTGKMKKVHDGSSGPVIGSISLAADGKTFVATASAWNHPLEAFAGTVGKNALRRLTQSNPHLADMTFGEQETITWKGPDDLEISGLLIKPVGYEAGKKYPLQMQVHGGPESVRLDGWNTGYNRLVQALAQRGIMVLIPNYRGSTGKGVAFAKGDQNDMMGKEFEDMLAGIDYLVDQGMVDPKKVGVGGGSYGGYTAAWAATKHSERFAVAVMFVGISNQISKGGMTDTPVENAVVHWDSWLYDNFEFVWERSPLKHIDNAQTPTLILHGKEDARVPVNQAVEMYRGLKYKKVPTQLVLYPREGHGNRERAHQLDLSTRTLSWYLKYLKGEKSKDMDAAL